MTMPPANRPGTFGWDVVDRYLQKALPDTTKGNTVQFVAEKNGLSSAVAKAARGTGAARSSPILNGVLLTVNDGTLHITGTDLDTTIKSWVPLAENTNGSAVVPAKLLADVVKSLPAGAVTGELGDDLTLTISGGRAKFNLRAFSANEFPTIPVVMGTGVKLDAAEFMDAAKQVLYAASADDARPLLTGVLFDASEAALRMVATDSYRLVVREVPGIEMLPFEKPPLIPASALSEVLRLLGTKPKGYISAVVGENSAEFEFYGDSITVRLLDGTYPDYRQLMPESYSYEASFNKAGMVAALKRVSLLVRDNSTPVRLSLDTETIGLSVTSVEVGKADEDVDVVDHFKGEAVTIAFNPRYLSEAISSCVTEDFVLSVENPNKPATIRELGNTNYQSLLMPVRVS